jgi:predicted Zn-ribbon and HTH transcriptional regulator
MKLAPKEAEVDLRHLLRSLKHTDYCSQITPASCRKCGFVFSSETLGKPSKCPKCRSTWLREARIGVALKTF